MRRALFPFATLTIAILSTFVLAEQSPIEIVVVSGSHQKTNLMALDSNINRIDEDDIERVNAALVSDILNRASGVYVQANNGVENLPSLRSPILTGPGAAGAFLFMQDSVSTRAAGFANNNALAELNFAQADAIEIIEGPNSAVYGSNAVHGVVNVLSLTPRDGTNVGITFGPNDRVQFDGTLGQVDDQSSAQQKIGLNLQIIDDGGYQDDSSYTSSKLGLRHDYQRNKLTVSSTLSGFDLAQNTAGFIASGDNGEGCFNSNYAPDALYKDRSAMEKNCDTDAYRQWSSIRGASHVSYQLSADEQINITPYFRSNSMEFRQHYLPSRAIEENSHYSLGVNTDYQWQVNDALSLVAGADIDWTQGKLTETQQQADMFSFGKARQQGVHFDYNVDATTISPFIQLNWQYNQALSFSSNLRFDSTEYRYDNLIADGTTKADGSSCINSNAQAVDCLYQRPSDRHDRFNNTSAKIGANYRLNDNVSIFTNWANGFRAPQTTDLYRLQNQQSIGTIDSEEINSVEGGIRGAFTNLQLQVTVYSMQKDNFFFRDDDGLNVTDGETTHKGIEVNITYQLLANLSLSANYAYAEHKYDFNRASSGVVKGNDIDTAPRQQGNARLNWQPTSHIDLELEWQHISSYYLDPANAHEYAGHDLLNVRGQWHVNARLSLNVKLENIADEKYASRADYAFGSYRYFGGQPRAVYVGAQYIF
ncbi:TonB-dependent receptor [Paraglaciecola sp. 20A4]|uniref:TonB-dependent receptor n=1 Tax=Paraglaciecola sp. 20A4 TaxID=2687288 RepID=UPI00140E38C5|nr:TonB-dependent receptor [Paraglaciecola sp. 20A4]